MPSECLLMLKLLMWRLTGKLVAIQTNIANVLTHWWLCFCKAPAMRSLCGAAMQRSMLYGFHDAVGRKMSSSTTSLQKVHVVHREVSTDQ